MIPPRVDELKAEPEVGKFYLVPHVVPSHGFFQGKWTPVYGPKHADPDLGFNPEHWHLDVRFAPNQFQRKARNSVTGSPFSLAIEASGSESILLRRKCVRPMLQYPIWLPNFLPKLEAQFLDTPLPSTLVCPHRGMPLGSLPAPAGCVTCPLHGLTWDLKARRLMPVTHEPEKLREMFPEVAR